MKKQELLHFMDDDLLDRLFGFCYARTSDSYEAQDLCSEILLALLNTAEKEGEIMSLSGFVWKIARNIHADYARRRKQMRNSLLPLESMENVLSFPAEEEHSAEMLKAIFHRIAFLTKAYRDIMIQFYLENLSIPQIALLHQTSEGAIRQRLYVARNKIKSEVENMSETIEKPVSLNDIEFVIWGTGNPSAGDPRMIFQRQFSKHIVFLCMKKPMTSAEVASELNVPTRYVEEEMEILTEGEKNHYGFLRRMEHGKYGINCILMDKNTIQEAHSIYAQQIPALANAIAEYVEKHRAEYLAFPYLNHEIDFNLILWQQIKHLSEAFSECVYYLLKNQYFPDAVHPDRPFSIFGHVDYGKHFGGGCDGVNAHNLCGYKFVSVENIYVARVRKHFHCGMDLANNLELQLALRSVQGLDIDTLSEAEKEHAAKAIQEGYLFREGNTLYTKILVFDATDYQKLFSITNQFPKETFEQAAQDAARKISRLIHRCIPNHLHGEWVHANTLANLPVLDGVIEALIEKGLLIPPKDGIGAEGCWMCIEK